MNVFICVLLICCSLFVLAKAVKEWREVWGIVSTMFVREEEMVEEEEVEEYYKPRYDVESYRKRMAELRKSVDQDGVFDYPVVPPRDDFTGTEINEED